MDESSSGPDLFDHLAHEFAERYRRGERPSLTEYADRCPDLADQIRELFPAMAMMEGFGGDGRPPPAPVGGRPRREGPMPERLGDYRILREIGRGGMGVVYEAVQESLGRRVALKVLSRSADGPHAQLSGSAARPGPPRLLHHTNIVPVFGVGEHEGVHYYAMQYIQGQGLDAVLREVVRPRRDGGRSAAAGPRACRPAGRRAPMPVTSTPTASWRARPATVGPARSPAAPDAPAEDRRRARGRPDPGAARSRYLSAASRGWASRRPRPSPMRIGHGVLHRDIKPANLLLDLEGTIWVTRLRPGQDGGERRADAPGRRRRHAALHGPRAVPGEGRRAERHLQPRHDAVRDAARSSRRSRASHRCSSSTRSSTRSRGRPAQIDPASPATWRRSSRGRSRRSPATASPTRASWPRSWGGSPRACRSARDGRRCRSGSGAGRGGTRPRRC